MGGLYTPVSPQMAIDGYTDPYLAKMAARPAYMGGDATINPFLSIEQSAVSPPNNLVSLMTGETNFAQTRQYGLWLDEPVVFAQGSVYVDTKTVEPVTYNPWGADVNITGTNGMQFASDIESSYVPTVFVNDVYRPLSFSFLTENTNSFSNLMVFDYALNMTQL
jgi:hypothetical protein